MTVQTTTDETARYVAQFNALATNGAAAAPPWLKQLRKEAIEKFATLGFPTTRNEKWRFTSIKRLVDLSFTVPKSADTVPGEALDQFLLPGVVGSRLVFVNGTFAKNLSSIQPLPTGARITSLAAALSEEADLVRQYLGSAAPGSDNPFMALNTAFASDGAFVFLPVDVVVDEPIQLLFISTAADQHPMYHPRNLLVLERGAGAQFVESYVSSNGDMYLTNAVTEIIIGDGAKAECYRIQRESESAYHIATTNSRQGRDSHYALSAVVIGAALSRHDIRMSMEGEGGEGTLNGLYVMRGSQHVDHNTVIDHVVPHCDSHEYFNGILDDHSRGVFNGRIIVRPGAQKTDSKQTNNNLLLSESARADSQPQLEIYADDVRCTHGATLGPLDREAIFYLQSRGLSAEAARALMTYGFSMEILTRIGIQELRDQLEALVTQRLAVDGAAGRVA